MIRYANEPHAGPRLLTTPPGRPSTGTFVRPRSRPAPFGVIYNPKATANVGKAPLRAIDTPCAVPTTQAELVDALREFRRREVGTVAVSGGDGTVRDVLSAIPAAYAGAPQPAIAILPAGRTDLIAGDVGAVRREDELARLLAGAKDGTLRRTTRPLVELDRVLGAGGRIRSVRGTMLGAAAFVYATELGQGEVHATGASHARAVTLTVAEVLRRLFLQGDPDGLRRGQPIGVSVDERPDGAGPNAHRSLFLATGLRQPFVLGRSPFYGPVDDDQLRFLDVLGPTQGVARAFAALVAQRPWMAGPQWRSGVARSLDLKTDSPVVVDGEIFEPVPGAGLRVRAGGPVLFVAP